MEVKRRVTGTGEEIVVQAADVEMPALVHGLIEQAGESGVAGFVQEVGHVVPVDVVGPHGAHVARQAARVVVHARAGADPARERAVGVDGAEVDGRVRERA